jgi:hypothetical protein
LVPVKQVSLPESPAQTPAAEVAQREEIVWAATGGAKERGLEKLRERARESDLLEERSGKVGVMGR